MGFEKIILLIIFLAIFAWLSGRNIPVIKAQTVEELLAQIAALQKRISNVQGKVVELNLRRTVLEDKDGKIHFIPNGQIKEVTNFSRKVK